jgi:hypothetical protein
LCASSSDQRQQKASKTVINIPGRNQPAMVPSGNHESKNKPFIHASPRGVDEVDSGPMIEKLCLNSGVKKKGEDACDCVNCEDYHQIKVCLLKGKKQQEGRDWMNDVFDDAMSGSGFDHPHGQEEEGYGTAKTGDGPEIIFPKLQTMV